MENVENQGNRKEIVFSCWDQIVKKTSKGRPHIGIYTLQIGSFSPNTATKFHGRRQPCRGILSCLVKKSLVLECFAVLNGRFFFTAATGDRVNTGCIPRETGAVVEEKIHSKPCKSLCEAAQGCAKLAEKSQNIYLTHGRGELCSPAGDRRSPL